MSQQINLFNPVFLKQRKIFTALAMARAIGLLLAGIVLLALYSQNEVSDMEREAASSAQQLERRKAQLASASAALPPRTSSPVLAAQVTYLEAQVKALREVGNVLDRGAFGNTHGYGRYFRAFARPEAAGVWLTGLAIDGAGTDITIDGRALGAELVPSYIRMLSAEPILSGKTFRSLQITTPSPDAAQPVPSAPGVAFVEFQLKAEPGALEP